MKKNDRKEVRGAYFQTKESRSPGCFARDIRLSRRVSSEIRATDRTVVVHIVAGIHAVRYHAARPAPAIKKCRLNLKEA